MTGSPTMWQIDLTPYTVRNDGQDVEFDLKGSFEAFLFNPRLELTVPQAFETKELLERVELADGILLIDTAEMILLRRAYDTLRSPHPNALGFLARIRDAKKVEVQAKEV